MRSLSGVQSPTRHASSQSNKGESIDWVFQGDEAAQVAGYVSYYCGIQPNEQNTGYKRRESLHYS